MSSGLTKRSYEHGRRKNITKAPIVRKPCREGNGSFGQAASASGALSVANCCSARATQAPVHSSWPQVKSAFSSCRPVGASKFSLWENREALLQSFRCLMEASILLLLQFWEILTAKMTKAAGLASKQCEAFWRLDGLMQLPQIFSFL